MPKLLLAPAFENGEWFPFGPAKIQIRHTSPKRMREIRKSVGLPAYPPPGEKLDDAQREALNDAVLDWTIQAWEGFADGNDQDAPCTSENRKKLVESHASLADTWIPEKTRLVYMKAAMREASDLGNSSGSSSGEQST